jgi:hypothetical protein
MAAITMTLMPLVLFAALGVAQAGAPASASARAAMPVAATATVASKPAPTGVSGEFAPHGLGLMQVTWPGIPPTSVARTRLVGDASLDA